MYGAFLVGAYPRSERLIRATRKMSKDLKQIFTEEKRKIIRLQVEKGFTYVSDPCIDWDDMLRPLTDGLEGIKRGPLARFFDNNTFYRQPIVINELKGNGEIILRNLTKELLPRGKLKVDLPDPFTFADLCDNRYYKDKYQLMFKFAEILSEELKNLTKAGFTLVQFKSPSITYQRNKDTLSMIGDAIKKVVKNVQAKTYMHLYFGDISHIISSILDFKLDGIGVDFKATRIESLKDYNLEKGLACGYINARNTKMESPEEIARFVRKAEKYLKPKEIFICPNCDLEFLPYAFANRKVHNIGKALELLRGSRHEE